MGNIRYKIWSATWEISMLGLPRGADIRRYFMYKHLHEIGKTLACKEGDILSISHSRLCDTLGVRPRSFTEANYPEYNFLSLPFADETFDFVFSDQVLEHVEGDPKDAIRESWRVLRPGGVAVHTTCFINPVHAYPGDYWRFTPDALRLLCKDFSNIIDCGGWGNFDVWCLMQTGLQWISVPEAKWHPLYRIATEENDPEWPIVTWIVAQK